MAIELHILTETEQATYCRTELFTTEDGAADRRAYLKSIEKRGSSNSYWIGSNPPAYFTNKPAVFRHR